MAYQSGHALEELSTLVAVVEAGGFTAAASRHGMRKGTLSLRVKSLEERLGVKLLARTTRSLRLTEEGQAFYEHAARAVQAASDAEGAVERAKGSPIGKLKVSTTAGLAGIILETAVIEYLRRYPKVALDLDTSSRKVDLMREDFDLALRVGAQEDSPLVQRRLGIARGGYFASRAYLKSRGEPASPTELARHDLISVPRGDGSSAWPFVIDREVRSLTVHPRLSTKSFELAVSAAVTGLGIVLAPEYFVREHVTKGRLVPLLVPFTQNGLEVFALARPGGLVLPKTRAFVDLPARSFQPSQSK
jgi:LysR family transcriptional regulator for bpeEF and oprC